VGDRSAGTYGWDGGFGSSWANDPVTGVTGVLLTNQMWTSPDPPPVCRAFWTAVHAAVVR
jgi:CubicO group peptidase (beta-lactamase class C family)